MRVSTLAALIGSLLACGGDGASGPGEADGGEWTGASLAGPCPLDARLGGFRVESGGVAPVVAGAVREAVLPLEVLDESMADGPCRIFTRPQPFCDPACGDDEVCALDESCVPYPLEQPLGTVGVTGLAAPVTMTADGSNHYTAAGVAEPLFADGALVWLEAEGGRQIAGFRLRGVGGPPLALGTDRWVLAAGEPLEIAWTPSGRGDLTVHVSMSVDQHGLTPSLLECNAADTGTLVIPAAMIDALLALGESGTPSARVQRLTADSIDVDPGCVDLVVAATVPSNELSVEVDRAR